MKRAIIRLVTLSIGGLRFDHGLLRGLAMGCVEIGLQVALRVRCCYGRFEAESRAALRSGFRVASIYNLSRDNMTS